MKIIINESQFRFLIEGKTKYTKDNIIKIAKNYDNYAEFQKKERGAYEAASKFGPCYSKNGNEVNCASPDKFNNSLNFLKNIRSHMETSFSSKDKIRDIAKKYYNYTEFRTKENGAYTASRKFGPCYDKNGNEVKCYINKSRSGGEMRNPDNVRNSLEFFNEITSGMTRTDFGPKMVYSYTFFDNENKVVGIYVGITNDEERRKKEHLTNKSTFTDKEEVYTAVGNFIKENPTFTYRYKKLTPIESFIIAQYKEKYFVEKYKSAGYNILNIAKTGGGGSNFGFPDKYLIDKVNDWIKNKKDKGEEPLLKDFTNDYRTTIYSIIGKRIRKGNDKLYDETLGKLVKTNTSKTNEELIKDAMSCNSFSEFLAKYRTTSYDRARDRGLIPQIKQMFADGLNTPDQTTPETTLSV